CAIITSGRRARISRFIVNGRHRGTAFPSTPARGARTRREPIAAIEGRGGVRDSARVCALYGHRGEPLYPLRAGRGRAQPDRSAQDMRDPARVAQRASWLRPTAFLTVLP